MINVRDFGALGDGVTDDSQAFELAQQAAVELIETEEKLISPIDGGAVVFVPPGFYLADIISDGRVSWLGERQQSVIMAATDGGYAMHFPNPPPHRLDRWQRAFVQGIAIQGTTGDREDRSRNGIRLENWYGLDLIDVFIWRCKIGMRSAENYYGTWDRLFVYECDIGIHLTSNVNNTHTGNKKLINPHLRNNGTALLIDKKAPRISLYGGTIEANKSGLVVDVEEVTHWDTANAVIIRDVWFEDNLNHSDFGSDITFRNGVVVPTGDIYLNDGALYMHSCGSSHVRLGSGGKLYAYFSYVGRGPSSSFLEIEDGGVFESEHSTVANL